MLNIVFGLSVATCALGLFAMLTLQFAMLTLQKERLARLSLVLGIIFWFAWTSSVFAALAQLP